MSATGDDEAGLIQAAQAGDLVAISALLERYQDRVFGFGLKMCGDPEDAKDVLQETLLAAARTMPGFRGTSSLSTWLYTIARSFCIKSRRQGRSIGKGAVSAEAAAQVASAAPGPEEAAGKTEIQRALATALQSLEPGAREVLILRDVEGLTAPEVAQVTGLGVDAVKSRLHRARLSLRAELEHLLGERPAPPAPGCPDVLAAYSRMQEGDLDVRLCAELQEHVDHCPDCRGACDSLKRTLAVCARTLAEPVPAPIRESVRAAVRAILGRAS